MNGVSDGIQYDVNGVNDSNGFNGLNVVYVWGLVVCFSWLWDEWVAMH
jgi:hypothetical protein